MEVRAKLLRENSIKRQRAAAMRLPSARLQVYNLG
jgi:hypothetical protein